MFPPALEAKIIPAAVQNLIFEWKDPEDRENASLPAGWSTATARKARREAGGKAARAWGIVTHVSHSALPPSQKHVGAASIKDLLTGQAKAVRLAGGPVPVV